MRISTSLLAGTLAGLFALGGCAGTGPAKPPSVDTLMRDYSGDVPGAVVLVLRDGQPLVRRGYGLADMDAGTPATPQTNFRLASVSQQFTAAAIVLLAQDGKLSLDDPIRKWLPSLPASADPITLRHIITHGSGLIDYEDLMPPGATEHEQVHDIDVLHMLEREDRLYFEPGTSYRYSNGAYALLALIVGKASGQDFATFLRERIFTPLGMDNTVAFEQGKIGRAHV